MSTPRIDRLAVLRDLSLGFLLSLAGCGAPGQSVGAADGGQGPGTDAEVSSSADPDAGGSSSSAPLRVMTYNIKHGADSSLEDVAATIRDATPDIVALQEVDFESLRSSGVDQAFRLGQLTGMASSYRQAFSFDTGGSYGVALLSEYPILSSSKRLLPSNGNEQRIAVAWRVLMPNNEERVFVVTHWGLDADERQAQADDTQAFMSAEEQPYMLMGDFNSQPNDAPLQTMTANHTDAWAEAGDGEGFTHPAPTAVRRIDYVLMSSGWETPNDAIVLESESSDHLPLLVELPYDL